MVGKKNDGRWMTRNQLQVLEQIAEKGRKGIPIWYTDLNLATIRSLAKRGMVDTASRGRILITRAGKRRLKQPWPPQQPTGDQVGSTGSDHQGGTEKEASAGSEGFGGLTD